MAAPRSEQVEKELRTPRAAGAAGIVFAVLLATTIIAVRSAVPARPVPATWLSGSAGRSAARVALTLLPFAGIAFLWFMGAVRSAMGEGEDRFYATVFLGSGLLFVAALFALAAETSGMLAAANAPRGADQLRLWQYERSAAFTLLDSYCMRMAAVFTLVTSRIGGRLGLFPRWLVRLGYLTALILLFVVTSVAWLELVFPLWALLVGAVLLAAGRPVERNGTGTASS